MLQFYQDIVKAMLIQLKKVSFEENKSFKRSKVEKFIAYRQESLEPKRK